MENRSEWNDYRSRLLAFVRGRIDRVEDAEDIVQDILLRAYVRRDTIRDAGKVIPWLYQIARNAIADHYRGAGPVTAAEFTPEELPAEESSTEPIRELAGCMGPLIDSLPPTYRDALRYSEIEGLTQQETAERLGISHSGAKSRVQRGRRKLAEELLECCRVEFDSRGGVQGFEARGDQCRYGADDVPADVQSVKCQVSSVK